MAVAQGSGRQHGDKSKWARARTPGWPPSWPRSWIRGRAAGMAPIDDIYNNLALAVVDGLPFHPGSIKAVAGWRQPKTMRELEPEVAGPTMCTPEPQVSLGQAPRSKTERRRDKKAKAVFGKKTADAQRSVVTQVADHAHSTAVQKTKPLVAELWARVV